MTAPDANSTAEALGSAPAASTATLPTPSAHPEKQPIPAKAKSQNIHVSATVLDAAQKDGEEAADRVALLASMDKSFAKAARKRVARPGVAPVP